MTRCDACDTVMANTPLFRKRHSEPCDTAKRINMQGRNGLQFDVPVWQVSVFCGVRSVEHTQRRNTDTHTQQRKSTNPEDSANTEQNRTVERKEGPRENPRGHRETPENPENPERTETGQNRTQQREKTHTRTNAHKAQAPSGPDS